MVAFVFFLIFLISFFNNPRPKTEPNYETRYTKLTVNQILSKSNYEWNDTDLVTQSRCWKVLKSNDVPCTDYSIGIWEVQHQTTHREYNVQPVMRGIPFRKDYWTQVYHSIYEHNKNGMQELKDTLYNYAQVHQLNAVDFANYMVSFVQDMPYWYIMEGNICASYETPDQPCISGFKYGILSPSEIAATGVGDCDSRTLLLYSLFRHFNYEVVIFVSDEYKHSMLGLNIPSTGKYLKVDGRKFYFWETTGKNWESGMIPPNDNVLSYWYVALSYNA
ncbi:MAG: hypothetical protein CL840_02440 [Crocinitomicaceae bacterium]|nr:hypothetical protein [Crocinitomicaceae bacterium]